MVICEKETAPNNGSELLSRISRARQCKYHCLGQRKLNIQLIHGSLYSSLYMTPKHIQWTLLSYYFIVNFSIELNKGDLSTSPNHITINVFPLDSDHGQFFSHVELRSKQIRSKLQQCTLILSVSFEIFGMFFSGGSSSFT